MVLAPHAASKLVGVSLHSNYGICRASQGVAIVGALVVAAGALKDVLSVIAFPSAARPALVRLTIAG